MEATVAVLAHVAAGLVLVAGVDKLRRPSVSREALAPARLPASIWPVRALGTGEIALAGTVLALGGRASFTVLALTYAGFVAVTERQRRAGRSCGCFGVSSTTAAGPLHLGVDLLATLAAGAAAWTSTPGLSGVLPPGTVIGGIALGLGAGAVVLARLVLTALPELMAVRSTVAPGARP